MNSIGSSYKNLLSRMKAVATSQWYTIIHTYYMYVFMETIMLKEKHSQ